MKLTTEKHVSNVVLCRRLCDLLQTMNEQLSYGFDFEILIEEAMLVAKANKKDWNDVCQTLWNNRDKEIPELYDCWRHVDALKDLALKTMYKTIRDRLGY